MHSEISEPRRLTRAQLGLAASALAGLLEFSGPADEALSRFFRSHRALGRRERAFVAEAVYAAVRRKRSLEAAAGSAQPRALVIAALLRVLGMSGRSLDDALAARRPGISHHRLR